MLPCVHTSNVVSYLTIFNILIKVRKCQFRNSLKEATFAGSFFILAYIQMSRCFNKKKFKGFFKKNNASLQSKSPGFPWILFIFYKNLICPYQIKNGSIENLHLLFLVLISHKAFLLLHFSIFQLLFLEH